MNPIKDELDAKEIAEAIKKIRALDQQMKNPDRNGMIRALFDAKRAAPVEISAMEFFPGANYVLFDAAPNDQLFSKLMQYKEGLIAHCIAKYGEKVFKEKLKDYQDKHDCHGDSE